MTKQGFVVLEMLIVAAIIGMITAIAVPVAIDFKDKAVEMVCLQNLRTIDKAKIQWAMENNQPDDAEPGKEELAKYIKGNFPKPAIADALYKIGNISVPASCSYHGDSLGNRPQNYKKPGYAFNFPHQKWVAKKKKHIPGDANKDGDVDFADYQILEAHFGDPGKMKWEDGDFNHDKVVDFADYEILIANFTDSK
ncbi:MAG: dockerin type I domain-containing protein [Candidatus Omnitrophota bacterium]